MSAISYADDVPDALRAICDHWAHVYRLETWEITVAMADSFKSDTGDDTETGAETTSTEPVRCSGITFRRGCTTEQYANYAAHEFLHIAHAGIDNAVHRIVRLLPERHREFALALYHDDLERFVVDVTHLITHGRLERSSGAPPSPE